MLWTLIGILIILWILGFSFDIAGGLVHLLLVIALIVLIFQMITGRKRP
ncbi:lmo0937 family membrane protein [Cytobacillus horneckiae]|nr:lmo0937 family membrane protein [Cytobacillus horneckiae]MBN6889103.1 lmo0937 family membrane protein [Cytobacillus horneckiae]MCM3180710.1 lmo0937 family membrane protein [Cytobacillus horneckiae]MEC1158308.1 lmo0937 family membrane protein [Cytobacillus horneckiae]MED2936462.1 lmo0937 family membrane protein [Cytobacillus horneckiae]